MNKFDIKKIIDNIIYNVYNIFSDVIFFLNFDIKKLVKKNIHFKNIHKGERCFILGTGPSLSDLNDEQIKKLSKEITFGVNSLYKSYVGYNLFPNYYTLIDNNYWEEASLTFKDIVNIYNYNPPTFITDTRAKNIVDNLLLSKSTLYIYSKKYPTNKVDKNLEKNIYALMNVVSYSIVSAMYMGFKEIYLLGCDYNAFCNFGHGHCYNDQQEMNNINYNLSFYLKYYSITTEFHYFIAKLAKANEVKIINLTDVSLLDAYPRHPVSSVL